MTSRTLAPLFLVVLAVAASAGVAAAADTGPAPLLGDYWYQFVEHWKGVFQKQNGVVMTALFFGVVCIFIITRGKWKK
jgi:Spy/CpxP family protein refolding chaperone